MIQSFTRKAIATQIYFNKSNAIVLEVQRAALSAPYVLLPKFRYINYTNIHILSLYPLTTISSPVSDYLLYLIFLRFTFHRISKFHSNSNEGINKSNSHGVLRDFQVLNSCTNFISLGAYIQRNFPNLKLLSMCKYFSSYETKFKRCQITVYTSNMIDGRQTRLYETSCLKIETNVEWIQKKTKHECH